MTGSAYNSIRVDDLPPVARDLVEVIGLPAAVRLVEKWGGVRIYVPATVGEDHPLARMIGVDTARALCEYCAGELLAVPRAAAALREARNREIRARYADGESQARLARAYALTERQVRNILGARPVDSRQAALF